MKVPCHTLPATVSILCCLIVMAQTVPLPNNLTFEQLQKFHEEQLKRIQNFSGSVSSTGPNSDDCSPAPECGRSADDLCCPQAGVVGTNCGSRGICGDTCCTPTSSISQERCVSGLTFIPALNSCVNCGLFNPHPLCGSAGE